MGKKKEAARQHARWDADKVGSDSDFSLLDDDDFSEPSNLLRRGSPQVRIRSKIKNSYRRQEHGVKVKTFSRADDESTLFDDESTFSHDSSTFLDGSTYGGTSCYDDEYSSSCEIKVRGGGNRTENTTSRSLADTSLPGSTYVNKDDTQNGVRRSKTSLSINDGSAASVGDHKKKSGKHSRRAGSAQLSILDDVSFCSLNSHSTASSTLTTEQIGILDALADTLADLTGEKKTVGKEDILKGDFVHQVEDAIGLMVREGTQCARRVRSMNRDQFLDYVAEAVNIMKQQITTAAIFMGDLKKERLLQEFGDTIADLIGGDVADESEETVESEVRPPVRPNGSGYRTASEAVKKRNKHVVADESSTSEDEAEGMLDMLGQLFKFASGNEHDKDVFLMLHDEVGVDVGIDPFRGLKETRSQEIDAIESPPKREAVKQKKSGRKKVPQPTRSPAPVSSPSKSGNKLRKREKEKTREDDGEANFTRVRFVEERGVTQPQDSDGQYDLSTVTELSAERTNSESDRHPGTKEPRRKRRSRGERRNSSPFSSRNASSPHRSSKSPLRARVLDTIMTDYRSASETEEFADIPKLGTTESDITEGSIKKKAQSTETSVRRRRGGSRWNKKLTQEDEAGENNQSLRNIRYVQSVESASESICSNEDEQNLCETADDRNVNKSKRSNARNDLVAPRDERRQDSKNDRKAKVKSRGHAVSSDRKKGASARSAQADPESNKQVEKRTSCTHNISTIEAYCHRDPTAYYSEAKAMTDRDRGGTSQGTGSMKQGSVTNKSSNRGAQWLESMSRAETIQRKDTTKSPDVGSRVAMESLPLPSLQFGISPQKQQVAASRAPPIPSCVSPSNIPTSVPPGNIKLSVSGGTESSSSPDAKGGREDRDLESQGAEGDGESREGSTRGQTPKTKTKSGGAGDDDKSSRSGKSKRSKGSSGKGKQLTESDSPVRRSRRATRARAHEDKSKNAFSADSTRKSRDGGIRVTSQANNVKHPQVEFSNGGLLRKGRNRRLVPLPEKTTLVVTTLQ